MQLMHNTGKGRAKETCKVTFEEAANAQNDINQWQATRDFRIHIPSILECPMMDIEQQEVGLREAHPRFVLVHICIHVQESITGMLSSQGSFICKYILTPAESKLGHMAVHKYCATVSVHNDIRFHTLLLLFKKTLWIHSQLLSHTHAHARTHSLCSVNPHQHWKA